MLLGIFKNNKNINKNPLNHIGNVINDLAYVFDKRLTKAIYNDLPESKKKNKTFLSHFFCNNLGYYSKSSSQCICNIGIFRDHCQTYGIECKTIYRDLQRLISFQATPQLISFAGWMQ